MKTAKEFFIELVWGIGLGIFISGTIIFQQSGWTNWILVSTGFVLLLIVTILKAIDKKDKSLV